MLKKYINITIKIRCETKVKISILQMPQIMDNLFRPALSFLKIKCNHIILPTGQHQKIWQSCVAYFYTKKESWCNLKKKDMQAYSDRRCRNNARWEIHTTTMVQPPPLLFPSRMVLALLHLSNGWGPAALKVNTADFEPCLLVAG